jgi:penicillin-binding protein 1A
VSVNYGVFGKLYSAEELKGFKNETASLVLSEDGALIGKFFAENRTNISEREIPVFLTDALVATEDARYFEHNGIDPWSLVRVLFKTLLLNDRSSGGGSTISQQLAKNMYGRKNFGPLTMPVNKCKEALLAYRMESVYNKQEIINLYLNTVPFGENVYGIEAAARRYFNTSTDKLKVEQAAVLIGILKANTAYNPRLNPKNAKKRRNVVLGQMEKYGYLKSSECDSLKELPLKLDYANLRSSGPANYFLVEVKRKVAQILEEVKNKTGKEWNVKKDGLIIETTLDSKLQKLALASFKKHLSSMQKQLRKQYVSGKSASEIDKMVNARLKRLDLTERAHEKRKQELFSWSGFSSDSISVRDSIRYNMSLLHAGLIAISPSTGAVKCWVGGIDYRTQPHDQIKAKRSLASTFKPILYATALESGVGPCTYLKNEKIILEDYDDWSPSNYDNSFGGKYSMNASLTKSLNIPTVNLYFQTEFKDIDYIWQKLGFSAPLHDAPSTALGTSSASVYELAIAYAAFANGGYKIEPQIIRSIKTAEGEIIFENKLQKGGNQVLKKETTQLLSQMLQNAINKGTGTSLRNAYGVGLPLAGKTGTSQNYADAWFAGYNPDLVMVSRVGASSPSIHFNSGVYGSGSKLALPLVALTLRGVERNRKLAGKYNSKFLPMPDLLMNQFDCEDFEEESKLEELLNVFEKDKTSSQKEKEKARKKKKSWFKRLFQKSD